MGEKSRTAERSCGFAFTDYILNLDFWEQFIVKHKPLYVIIGAEICPKTGADHWQGHVYFETKRSWKKFRKIVEPRHWETCIASSMANEKYCGKDGTLVMNYGIRPAQGTRTDLDAIKDRIIEGERVSELAMENPSLFHQYGRTLNYIEDLQMRKKKRTSCTLGLWIHGEAGSKKSELAFILAGPDVYVWTEKWWDGYTGQKVVVIDDIRRSKISMVELLRLIDRFPHSVPRRNREPMPFTSELVIMTNINRPEIEYPSQGEDDNSQLLRRLTIRERVKKGKK